MSKRYGYARVSTDDQSLDIQNDLLTKAGCDVIRAEKVSGKSVVGREQLRILLDFIGKGDVLVVTKLDRLGRNLLDILLVIEEVESKGAQIVSLGEKFDTTSPMGVAMFQVAGVFAQLERAMIRARQKEGIEAAKAKGDVYKGGAVQHDPAKIRELRAQGHMPAQINKIMGASKSTIKRALKVSV
jgi:DNA invertase Pin-like site-specific DNA recombinase